MEPLILPITNTWGNVIAAIKEKNNGTKKLSGIVKYIFTKIKDKIEAIQYKSEAFT